MFSRRFFVATILCSLLAPAPALASAASFVDSLASLAHAQAGDREGDLEPRYEPREPEPEPAYDSSLVFATTRAVADSTIVPAGKVPLYVLTIPVDIAFLPFALIGGLF
jgi:hypothetical protein